MATTAAATMVAAVEPVRRHRRRPQAPTSPVHADLFARRSNSEGQMPKKTTIVSPQPVPEFHLPAVSGSGHGSDLPCAADMGGVLNSVAFGPRE
uniref:Uncharacterized protein n=1 Tax=Oryza punctata TaxID=4537 RepID=A0A0E0ME54_ORYPU